MLMYTRAGSNKLQKSRKLIASDITFLTFSAQLPSPAYTVRRLELGRGGLLLEAPVAQPENPGCNDSTLNPVCMFVHMHLSYKTPGPARISAHSPGPVGRSAARSTTLYSRAFRLHT